MKRISTVIIIAALLTVITQAQDIYPKREFRAAWIAAIYNIDWPSSLGNPQNQIKELIFLLDKLKEAGINAVFFQVRAECDAFYYSSIEPWSYWLTGKQGSSPTPFYDPLRVAIEEAHKRGMELHAWLNPYRALNNRSYSASENHVTRRHPQWILDFGSYKMLDPGLPEVRNHITKVVKDIITRYDVDGIHFDDYFYPYDPVITYQDYNTFIKHNRGIRSIEDWRRDNINLMIAEVNNLINLYKPNVKFGVSPFGIVDNRLTGTKGLNAYSVVYCDPLTWIRQKTVDYIVPQIYWEIGKYTADYARIAPWWASVKEDRHLYIGHYSAKMIDPLYRGSRSEMGGQIRLNRENGKIYGSVFFSAKSIANNFSNFADSLRKHYFKHPALIPTMFWKDSIPPLAPVNLRIEKEPLCIVLSWDAPHVAADGDMPERYIIYRFSAKEKINLDNPAKIIHISTGAKTIFRDYELPLPGEERVYVVSSLDKLHNESREFAEITFPVIKPIVSEQPKVRQLKGHKRFFKR